MSRTISVSADTWEHVQRKVLKTTHIWVIDGVKEKFWKTDGTSRTSSIDVDEYKFDITLENDTESDVFIRLIERDERKAIVSLKVDLVNDKQKKILQFKEDKLCWSYSHFYLNYSRRYSLFKRQDLIDGKLNDLLVDDKLVIYCELSVQTECVLTGREKLVLNLEQIRVPLCDIVDDYRSLLEDKEHSDVTICVNKKEYQAHRAILAARSPKFKAMFRSNMRESREGRVELSNIEEDVFKELINYIYTGRSSLEDKPDYLLAIKLTRAADEYQLNRLKSICEKALDKTVSVENAIEILLTASLFRLSQLEEKIYSFIFEHINEILQMVEWKKLAKENPSLVSEVLAKFVSYRHETNFHQVKN